MTDAAHAAVRPGGGGARTLTAAAVARAVNGRLVGSESVTVTAIAPLDRAGPSDLSFLAASRYVPLFARSSAGVVLIAPELADAEGGSAARIIVEKPHEALLALLPEFYATPAHEAGIHESARIGRGARVADDARVGPYAVVGDGAVVGAGAWIDAHVVIGAGAQVGPQCRLHPGVVLYPGTRLGARVQIHAGARIGSDGFGYVYRDGAHRKIPHVGQCVIDDDVEIGANSTIDRGSIDDTVVGAGTKIDNLVHVGHNVRIGRLCLIMAQVGIAGSAHIGDGVIIAGQAGLGGHIEVGDGARIGGQSGVFGDVPAGQTWSGYPARPHRESLRATAALFKLAGLVKSLERLVAREKV